MNKQQAERLADEIFLETGMSCKAYENWYVIAMDRTGKSRQSSYAFEDRRDFDAQWAKMREKAPRKLIRRLWSRI